MRNLLVCAIALGALASGATASVLQLFDSYVPLLDPQNGVTVRRVTFCSRYSQPESTVGAAVWPCRVNAGPGEETPGNLNPANLINVKVSVARLVPNEGRRPEVTLDLRELRPLPESVLKRHPDVSRADIVRGVVVALHRNLQIAGIADCRLVVKGAVEHEDLAAMRFPDILNPAPSTPSSGDEQGDTDAKPEPDAG
ncbi:MAG: hypothetical protein R6X33_07900 [Candidatus Brocadiia bacterium]